MMNGHDFGRPMSVAEQLAFRYLIEQFKAYLPLDKVEVSMELDLTCGKHFVKAKTTFREREYIETQHLTEADKAEYLSKYHVKESYREAGRQLLCIQMAKVELARLLKEEKELLEKRDAELVT